MAYESAPIVQVRSNVIRIKHPNIDHNPKTYLGATAAAAATSLTVRDNAGFLSGSTNNERILVGSYGDERAEIKRITADPTAGTSLTVAAITFAHPIDTPVTMMLWDQVEIQGNATNTTTGATSIVTMSLTPDEDFTQYVVTGTTYNFYFARYRNSTIPRNSGFSDGVDDDGLDAASRSFMKQRALARAGIGLGYALPDGEVISDDWLNAEVTACEQEIQRRSNKWAFLLTDNFSAPIAIVQGQRNYALPTTIIDNDSNKSIVSARLSWNRAMTYLDPVEFNSRTYNIIYTTVATSFTTIDTSIVLTDSGDFADSGSILIGTDTIDYTGNTRSTGTLTGVTNISANHTAADEVYQNAASGLPTYYTVKNGNIILHPIPDSNYHQRNLNMEFYRTITPLTTDGTATVVPFYNIFDLWLLWRIAERRKLFEEATKWETAFEKLMFTALQSHVKAQDQYFYPGMADPQLLDYDRGRLLSSSIS